MTHWQDVRPRPAASVGRTAARAALPFYTHNSVDLFEKIAFEVIQTSVQALMLMKGCITANGNFESQI